MLADEDKHRSTLAAMEALLTELRKRPTQGRLHEDGIQLLRSLRAGTSEVSTTHLNLIAGLLTVLLSHDLVKHQAIATLAIGLLKSRHGLAAETAMATHANLVQALARDDLFLATLRKVINVDGEFEIVLQQLRRLLLFQYRTGQGLPEDLLPLIEALAQQCFNNEYIIDEDEDERRAVQEIEARLERTVNATDVRNSEIPLLLLGMYRPLAGLPFVQRIADVPLESFSAAARPAIARTIHEPLEEKRLSQLLPSFGAVACATSTAVRAQYEENPYPRWFNLTGQESLEIRLRRLNPAFSWPFSAAEGFDILVPGCGTGQHPLKLAAANPGAHVLAMDLSRSSLAYGTRMAAKLQIPNVSFLHGDLLEIPKLGKRFHHIDCFGVLHHMKDPMAGWQALDQVLLPGGTLGIGVYSAVARMHVGVIREEIRRLAIQPTAEAMKSFRHQLLTDEKYKPLLKHLRGTDFFTLSGLRDYLFHTSEYGYTLSEMQNIIEHFGFRFLGFNAGWLRTKYLELFPDDPRMNSLEHWRRFEVHYAGSHRLFSCWLQKPALDTLASTRANTPRR